MAEDTDYINERARYLHAETGLRKREAEIQSLLEQGLTHQEIAYELHVAKGTIGALTHRIKQRRREAAGTLIEIGTLEDLVAWSPTTSMYGPEQRVWLAFAGDDVYGPFPTEALAAEAVAGDDTARVEPRTVTHAPPTADD